MSDDKKLLTVLQLLDCFKAVAIQVPGMPPLDLGLSQPNLTPAKNPPTALEKSTEAFLTKEQAEEIQDKESRLSFPNQPLCFLLGGWLVCPTI